MSTNEKPTLTQDVRLQLVMAYLQGAGGVVPPADKVTPWIAQMTKFVETGKL